MNFYVYAYIDPINHTVFYIGKGSGDRYLKHLYENYNNTENKKKYAYIKGLHNKGHKPIIIKFYENLDETSAYDIEEKLIKFFGRKDIDKNGCLTNICTDNRPPRAIGTNNWDETVRLQMSQQRKGEGNPMYGKTWSEERRAKAPSNKGKLNPFFGKSHTQESIDKMLQTRKDNGNWFIGWPKGKPRSEETRNKLSDKWLITDPNGNKFEIVNLAEFSKSIKVNPEALRISATRKKGKTKCGWRAEKINNIQ